MLFRSVRAGWTTWATGRSLAALAELAAVGCRTAALDVTDEDSVVAAVEHVLATSGAIDVLVNNAGAGPSGAIEEFSLADWRRLFETNVFGVATVTRHVLPAMRARGQGRIIIVGSMGGEFTTPLVGAYHASKYAVEAVADALRVEVAPFGIQVALIQPGPVKTRMAAQTAVTPPGEQSLYAPALARMRKTAQSALATGTGFLEPAQVAAVILRAATRRRSGARHKIGVVAHLLPWLRRWLPLSWWDAMQASLIAWTTKARTAT